MDELNLQDTPQEDTAQEDTAQTQNHPVIPGASCPEPPEMADALLCCQDLSKHYGGKQALAQINLTLPQGKIIGLLGPNGSGKTTLIKLACGLIHPTSGKILIKGQEPGIESKKLIAYLPEQSYLNGWMRVGDLIAMFKDFYSDFSPEKAREMLINLHIDEKERLKTLSKGTQEKIQLILVMSRNAKLFLLDEPIGGVDPAARDYILRTIIKNYNDQATVLISTHLISDVESILDQAIFLNQGKITVNASVDTLREQNGKSLDAMFREVFRC